jgi:hypothetical protein
VPAAVASCDVPLDDTTHSEAPTRRAGASRGWPELASANQRLADHPRGCNGQWGEGSPLVVSRLPSFDRSSRRIGRRCGALEGVESRAAPRSEHTVTGKK